MTKLQKSQPTDLHWVTIAPDLLGNAEDLQSALFDFYNLDVDARQHYVQPDYQLSLHDPAGLSGVPEAVERIVEAVRQGDKIAIYGDYDIDGITATALMCDVLMKVGADVLPYIPDRFEEGYGLNSEALKALAKLGVTLVITVDCGITAHQQVSEAAGLNIDIIITDHHTVPPELPSGAVALINPLIPRDTYPFKVLAGVGVAFKLACAVMCEYPDICRLGQEKWLLDLVALGTVCDVVPLIGENRALVQFGLKVLRKSPRVGLQALAEVSGVELSEIKASDLGFRLGPRLNAAGRLEHANKALELLMTTDKELANELATELNALNRERQQDTTRVFEAANAQAAQYVDDAILVLAGNDWSHGIVGLVASRVSEAWHKPTLLLQTLGTVTKGSARSVGGFSIIDALTDSSNVLDRFGGHAFAAGMTLQTRNVPVLRRQLNAYIAKTAPDGIGPRELVVLGRLKANLLTTEVARLVAEFEPFSNGNPEPIFSAPGIVSKVRPVGSDLSHLQITLSTEESEIGCIAFGGTNKWPWLEVGVSIEVAFRLDINIWQGVERLQLNIVDIHRDSMPR